MAKLAHPSARLATAQSPNNGANFRSTVDFIVVPHTTTGYLFVMAAPLVGMGALVITSGGALLTTSLVDPVALETVLVEVVVLELWLQPVAASMASPMAVIKKYLPIFIVFLSFQKAPLVLNGALVAPVLAGAVPHCKN